MNAVYNEIEPFAADWLVNLAREGHIAGGAVDRRSVVDLDPADVGDATQFHAFAGIGCWSLALRLAGVADDDRVWTGSCPCQPFSAAGKRRGFDDERHLWPAWFRLIRECRPPIVFGEQVASADGRAWLDVVSADLENAGYAVASANLCAGCVGAPHRRQRLFFVAHTEGARRGSWRSGKAGRRVAIESSGLGDAGDMAYSDIITGGQGGAIARGRPQRGHAEQGAGSSSGGGARDMADANVTRTQGRITERERGDERPSWESSVAVVVGDASGTRSGRDSAAAAAAQAASQGGGIVTRRFRDVSESTGATRGFWAAAEWVECIDGKARPVEPGVEPLAHGVAGRVGKLRAYGNAIVAEVAAQFIAAALDAIDGVVT